MIAAKNKTIAIDTPLAEVCLRRYEKPYNLSKRELVRKLCLSVGLLQPGDSRDVVVDVLYVLLEARRDGKELSSEEVREDVIGLRKNEGLVLNGIASSNIRRQLKRLRDVFLVEKVKNNYRIAEFTRISEGFDEKLAKFLIPNIIERVKEYYRKVDEEF
ncbi:hypothetical protein C0585_07955 [Candidatus Woesearchaeota archaeon]|nr:MAG: hypothetical protein C0585_07955 [Candidatus Woesearchaeota archaeon]